MRLITRLPLLLSLVPLVLSQGPPRATDQVHNITYTGAAFSGIESFQGIRFGQETSGVNRFKHPKPFTYPNDSTVDATQPGAACPQNTVQTFLGITQNETVTLSEDCLNLLVVRAGGTKQNAKLPVMVWIYGGGDETGAANVSLWEPTKLVSGAAQKGTPVVYVAMNYRLNVFGFANSPALRAEKSLNSGILDQRLALEWVQKNIAIFGGDPKKVTVFGQSDGATGAGLHMTSYGGKGTVPFQRAIFESGGPAGDPGVSSNPSGTLTSTSEVARLAGCTTKPIIPCLRKLTYQKLLDAVIKYENVTAERGSFQDIFYPTIDGDYIPAAPTQLLREGRFHRNISVIAGWTYNDGSIFTDTTLHDAPGVDAYLQKAYPHLNATTRNTLTTSLYPVASFQATAQASGAPSAFFLQAAQIYRDINFACPAIDVTHRVAQYSPKTPVYLYDFNSTSFGLLEQFANATFLGVIHTSEILFAFNQPALGGVLPISDEQKELGVRVSGSWAKFAASGTPTAAAGGGDTSLAGWDVAYSPGQAAVKVAAVDEVNVRVIGGPSAGQYVLRTNGAGVEAGLLRRCAFINSIVVQSQVQT